MSISVTLTRIKAALLYRHPEHFNFPEINCLWVGYQLLGRNHPSCIINCPARNASRLRNSAITIKYLPIGGKRLASIHHTFGEFCEVNTDLRLALAKSLLGRKTFFESLILSNRTCGKEADKRGRKEKLHSQIPTRWAMCAPRSLIVNYRGISK